MRRLGFRPAQVAQRIVNGFGGAAVPVTGCHFLPLIDVRGKHQVICAFEVEEITTVAETRLPPWAREVFPSVRAQMPWMDTPAGPIELLIGLDNRQWLPAHVEDSWDPDDDMRLMRSVFGHRYMITDGWGRDLLPPDNAPGDPAGAQGGAVEQADAAQEVQLPEYRGWSQSTWNPGKDGGLGTAGPRGGCMGARPKTRWVTSSRGAPATRGRVDRGSGSGGPSKGSRDPPAPQARFGAAQPQVSRGARPRFRVVPPPKRRPSPSPPPAPGRGRWNWLRSSKGGRGQQRAIRMQPPRRPPSPDPGRVPGPLQLMGPGDDPMQRLALMMAVMMLGMPPVSGYSASVGPGSRGSSRDDVSPFRMARQWQGSPGNRE
jgi:hypothetical protein